MADWELAQINVARLIAPVDDPAVAEFMNALDEINAVAGHSPGFVWRFQTDDGNATAVRPYEDESILINVSTWASITALSDYVYRSAHTPFLRRRAEWFLRTRDVFVALWWVRAGHRPSTEEAIGRLEHLRAHGPTPRAFTFRHTFAPDTVED